MDSAGDRNLDRAQKYLDLVKQRAQGTKGLDLPTFEMMKKRQKRQGSETKMKKKQKLDPGNLDPFKEGNAVPKSTDKLKKMMKTILDKCEDILDVRGKDKDIESDSDEDSDPNSCIDFDDVGERIGSKDKTSNFTRERVSRVKVTKAQYTVQLDQQEIDFYNSEFFRRGFSRQPTKAERKRVLRASDKSQGFDIPFLPGVGYLPIFRVNLSHEPAAIEAAQLSKLALKWYNKAKGTNYALQRIVKSTGKPCAYLVYCITFMATENSGPAETFQARVWLKINFNVHIMMCRKKGEPDTDWKLIDYSLEENDDEELVEYYDDDDDDDDEESQEDDDDEQSQEDDDNDDEVQEDDDQPQPQRQKDE